MLRLSRHVPELDAAARRVLGKLLQAEAKQPLCGGVVRLEGTLAELTTSLEELHNRIQGSAVEVTVETRHSAITFRARTARSDIAGFLRAVEPEAT